MPLGLYRSARADNPREMRMVSRLLLLLFLGVGATAVAKGGSKKLTSPAATSTHRQGPALRRPSAVQRHLLPLRHRRLQLPHLPVPRRHPASIGRDTVDADVATGYSTAIRGMCSCSKPV